MHFEQRLPKFNFLSKTTYLTRETNC